MKHMLSILGLKSIEKSTSDAPIRMHSDWLTKISIKDKGRSSVRILNYKQNKNKYVSSKIIHSLNEDIERIRFMLGQVMKFLKAASTVAL